jgi:hypothetical protein
VLRALIHKYDNKDDILAVEENRCSEVYCRSRDDTFEIVIVVPTRAAQTTTAVFGKALGPQYTPKGGAPWPGRPDTYPIRVDLGDIQYTTLDKVRAAVTAAGGSWVGQWVVAVRNVDENLL